MRKMFLSALVAALLTVFGTAGANEYLDLKYQMRAIPRQGIGDETLENIVDLTTPETPQQQTTFAYIFHLLMERQPPVAELGLTTGFFLPVKKGDRLPTIHNVYFYVDGDKIPRATLEGSGSAKATAREKGVFFYVDLGVENDLIRRIAESKKTTVAFTGLSLGIFGAKDKTVAEIVVTPEEKEAMKRVMRFYELMKEDYESR